MYLSNMLKFNSYKYPCSEAIQNNELQPEINSGKQAETSILPNVNISESEITTNISKNKMMGTEAYSLKVDRLDDSMREIFSCRICSFRTTYFYRLRAHFWTHEADASFADSICAFEDSHTALYNTYLLSPSTLEAIDKSLGKNISNTPSNYNKEHVCSHCPYITNEIITLKDHILTHIEEKPFCGKLNPIVIMKPSHVQKPLSTNQRMQSYVIKDKSFSNTRPPDEIIDTVVEVPFNRANDDNFMINSLCEATLNETEDDPIGRVDSCEMSTIEENGSVANMAASQITTEGAANIPMDFYATDEGPVEVANSGLPSGHRISPPPIKVNRLSDRLRKKSNTSPFRSNIIVSNSTSVSNEGSLPTQKRRQAKYHCCDRCPYKTSNEKHLERHAITHSDEKPFACLICPFRTKYLSSLNSHSAAHSGTQRYGCDHCSFRTSQLYNLKEHTLIHTGGKKYLCDICSYQSIKQSSFKNHLLKHTGEKPHSCNVCSFKTAAKHRLVRHLENVHKNGRKVTKLRGD